MFIKSSIHRAISQVLEDLNYKIDAKNIIESITVKDKKVVFIVKDFFETKREKEIFKIESEKKVLEIKKVEEASLILVSYKKLEKNTEEKKDTKDTSSENNSSKIKHIITVASGKGGVGKSTISVEIAINLAEKGYRVGLIDADISGPSIFRMLNLNDKLNLDEQNHIIPFIRHGVKVISIGSLAGKGGALIWRGPMLVKALYRLFSDVVWGDIDYMIVDTPPGTGDIHITLAKNFSLSATILVSTPQEVALDDLERSFDMFRKFNIPVLGVIKNMSYFLNPESGKKEYIFGKSSLEVLAKKNEIEYLGEIALIPYISENADKGKKPVFEEDFPKKILDKIISNLTIE